MKTHYRTPSRCNWICLDLQGSLLFLQCCTLILLGVVTCTVVTDKCQSPAQAAPVSVPMPPEKPEPPDLVVVQSHSGTDYHQPMSQLSDISGSVCPEYPLSQHRYPACPAPELQQA
ncbi:hypothetical protein Tco_0465675 [Tanacetum coccineum]